MDKFLHFIAYAILGVLFFRAYRTLGIGKKYKLLILISILSSSLYGISDELHQHFVPQRQADVIDALANILGSITGVLLYPFLGGQQVSQEL